jgi:hypothetical protein
LAEGSVPAVGIKSILLVSFVGFKTSDYMDDSLVRYCAMSATLTITKIRQLYRPFVYDVIASQHQFIFCIDSLATDNYEVLA